MNKRILFTAVSVFVLIEMLVVDFISMDWGLAIFKFFGGTFMAGIWLAVVKAVWGKLSNPFFSPELPKIPSATAAECALYYFLILYPFVGVFWGLKHLSEMDLLKCIMELNMPCCLVEGLVVIAIAKAIRRWRKTGDRRELLFPWPVK